MARRKIMGCRRRVGLLLPRSDYPGDDRPVRCIMPWLVIFADDKNFTVAYHPTDVTIRGLSSEWMRGLDVQLTLQC